MEKEKEGRNENSVLCLLEERLEQHDSNRKEIQEQLQEIYSSLLKEVDSLEEKLSGEAHNKFSKSEEKILGLIESLNGKIASKEENSHAVNSLMKKVRNELSSEPNYEIRRLKKAKCFAETYKISVTKVKIAKKSKLDNDEDDDVSKIKCAVCQLKEHLSRTQESMNAACEELAKTCAARRSEIEKMEKRITGELETLFTREDARLQGLVNLLKREIGNDQRELVAKANAALVKNPKYSLRKAPCESFADNFVLDTKEETSLKYICFESRKPTGIVQLPASKGKVYLSFAFFSDDEKGILGPLNLSLEVVVKMWEKGRDENSAKTYSIKYSPERIAIDDMFVTSMSYCLKMKLEYSGSCSLWSDCAEIVTPNFAECCVWKKCPDDVSDKRKYVVDEENPRVATNVNDDNWCTIIVNAFIPPNAVSSWNVKILESKKNGNGIKVGVAPFDINQNSDYIYEKCGWYFNCFRSSLSSGPPHNYYRDKNYGPKKDLGRYVHTGDSVGVVMDTAKGELSFVLGGVNHGVAYEGIPLDKPLVPCVVLFWEGDSVELDTF